MKKYFVFIVLFILIGGISMQAQVKFGLKVGVNLANASLSEVSLDAVAANLNTENLTGFQAGPMIEAMLPALGLGFDAAVLYSQQGFKLPVEGSIPLNFEKVKLNTLQVPVNLKYKLMLVPKLVKMYANAGPYISLNFPNKLGDLINDIESKSFGAGLNFGLGAELLSHLQVGFNYQVGLTDDFSNIKWKVGEVYNIYKGRTTGWSFAVAYLF